jgi:CHAP domain-containing protein
MGVLEVQARIAQLQGLLSPQPAAAPATISGSAPSSFQTQLSSAAGTWSAAGAGRVGAPSSGGTPAGQAILNLVRGEVGVTEQPPGSNDAPRIAQYRQATAGSGVGPWCAYFTSWAAAQAGVPLGEAGQGFGSVSALYGWAQRTGRATPAGPGVHPNPGDLIVWGGEHIGIVESVDPDGSIHTIEGNSSNAVSRRTYGPDGGGATGYVRLG